MEKKCTVQNTKIKIKKKPEKIHNFIVRETLYRPSYFEVLRVGPVACGAELDLNMAAFHEM